MPPISTCTADIAKLECLPLATPADATLDLNSLKSTARTEDAAVFTSIHTPHLGCINHQAQWVYTNLEGTQAQWELACKVKAV
jgi:uncharacterized membrane protein